MEELINFRAELEQIHKHQPIEQIRVLMQLGMYELMMSKIKAIDKFEQLENIIRLLQSKALHSHAIQVMDNYKIFEKQFDITADQSRSIFKLYFIQSLVDLKGIQEALNQTKHMYSDDIRKEIQAILLELYQEKAINVNIAEQPKLIQKRSPIITKKNIAYFSIILIFMLILLRKRLYSSISSLMNISKQLLGL